MNGRVANLRLAIFFIGITLKVHCFTHLPIDQMCIFSLIIFADHFVGFLSLVTFLTFFQICSFFVFVRDEMFFGGLFSRKSLMTYENKFEIFAIRIRFVSRTQFVFTNFC